jgi:hypothetical protein
MTRLPEPEDKRKNVGDISAITIIEEGYLQL